MALHTPQECLIENSLATYAMHVIIIIPDCNNEEQVVDCNYNRVISLMKQLRTTKYDSFILLMNTIHFQDFLYAYSTMQRTFSCYNIG